MASSSALVAVTPTEDAFMPDNKPTHASHGGKHVAKRAASPINPYDHSDIVRNGQWKLKVVPTGTKSRTRASDEKSEVPA